MRKQSSIRLIALLTLSISTILSVLVAPQAATAAESQFFPQTGHTVSGPFLAYWQTHGGLAIFGYPIGEAQTERDTFRSRNALIQWFERARFELHPERAGTPYEVELNLLGSQVTYDRLTEPAFQPITPFPNRAEATFFPQTGHGLSAGFKQFWETHGALPIFGYPLSEEFPEQNPSDGQRYSVQYFERARFEYHPANPPAYQVELGLPGSQLIATALPVKQVNVTIAAGTAQTTIGLDETALVVSDAPKMTVAIQFPEPVNPAAFQVQIHQLPGRDAWQIAPASRTPSLSEYVFDLQGGVDRPAYVRVDITRGVANPILVFGIQVGNGQTTPSLRASWNALDGLIQSYYNAVNQHEYARAYGAWETPGAPNGVTPVFKDFVSGYANVASVAVPTGARSSKQADGHAYAVPRLSARDHWSVCRHHQRS